MPISTEVFWRVWVWHFPSAPSTLGPWDVLYYALSKLGRDSVPVLEWGQSYGQSSGEEKGIRDGSNSLSSLISGAVYLQVFLQLSFSFSTNLQWNKEICSVVASRESCKTWSCQGQEMEHMSFAKAIFFLIRSAVMQGKGPSTGPDASLVVRK